MSNPNVFTITAEITYRPFRTPPRCRNPRQVPEIIERIWAVPSVTSDVAPVVALIPNDRGFLGSPGGGEAEIRSFDGKLWTVVTEQPDCTSAPLPVGSEKFPADVTLDFHVADADEATEFFTSRYGKYLIVDGFVWRETAEPVYTVECLGWGNNSGGTYMSIGVVLPNRRDDRMFTLIDYEAAVDGALAIAKEQGDDKWFDRIRRTPKATILDPTAFKVPSEKARIAAAENDVRQRAATAVELLKGDLTKDVVGQVQQALKDIESAFWNHGLESVKPASL
jgi:hypothetical protein